LAGPFFMPAENRPSPFLLDPAKGFDPGQQVRRAQGKADLLAEGNKIQDRPGEGSVQVKDHTADHDAFSISNPRAVGKRAGKVAGEAFGRELSRTGTRTTPGES